MQSQVKEGKNDLGSCFERIESYITWLHTLVQQIMVAEAVGKEDSAVHGNQNIE